MRLPSEGGWQAELGDMGGWGSSGEHQLAYQPSERKLEGRGCEGVISPAGRAFERITEDASPETLPSQLGQAIRKSCYDGLGMKLSKLLLWVL